MAQADTAGSLDQLDKKDIHKQTKSFALKNPAIYWESQADLLSWHKKWDTVKDVSFAKKDVHIRWFDGGTLNVCENCVDRHVQMHGDKIAIIWEPDNPESKGRIITYRELQAEVMRTANMLKALGVKAGDPVTIYMPMVPEAAFAMLACARIGAVHSVVFGGFSAHALRSRIEDCDSRVVITADGSNRGGKTVSLKENVDEAVEGTTVEKVLVLHHTDRDITWHAERDVWWHELADTVPADCPIESFDAEHPLFVLYTSGSTGQPKGLLHTSAGYLLYATHTFKNVFDYKDGDIYWCTADVGWITGHSYIVYGPLAAGATTVMFEGVPTYPDASRMWNVVDKYNISLFYTAPTAIRMLMREGDEFVQKTSRKSLRILGSVGEPINSEAWNWYHDVAGEGHCQVMDTWWQTETGGHMITPLPDVIDTKPGSATLPYYGIDPVLFDAEGVELDGVATGALCIRDSWPGQARTIWGDHQRFIETYFSAYENHYFSGDAVHRDGNGYYWIEGRMDDVINMAGHRLGTAEIEAALNLHENVVESAVVGIPDDLKGQAIYAFVIAAKGVEIDDAMRSEMNQILRKEVGPIASVKLIQQVPGLPKTRSGKIMRRILRKIAGGDVTSKADFGKLGDISTLVNPEEVEVLVEGRLS